MSVVDDYAHNPDKVAAVVQAGLSVTQSTGGRLVVVFQPHLYSRTQHFVAQFAAGLSAADVVSVLDIYGAREEPIAGVTSQLITQAIADLGGATQVLDDVRDLAQAPTQLAPLLRAGDLVLTVGAGDITTLGPRLVDALSGAATDQNGGATADD
ncbi:glutamate ligase domain-containing protein [Ornithinimicrobium sp. INDO-MA30-4]|uniref:glutamate ligase domain-containing protein n=1 Tax=Ornithinimicrobium sp. INDO-MA30-4 TaxID=2908651 RepID=UPI002882ED27|nr:cyanophycin synthetase [Ornithinimicrobium sp. INDO-MA30-4]